MSHQQALPCREQDGLLTLRARQGRPVAPRCRTTADATRDKSRRPPVAARVMMAAATLSDSPRTARSPLDIPGITTLGAGMTLLTAALVETRHGWSAVTTLVLFCAATLMLGAFAAVELRSRRPMLDPHLLAQPQFVASISGALFIGLAVVGLMSYAPALMQQALHISVIGSAAVLAAWSATSMVVALAAGSLPSRLPAQTRLIIGLSLAAVGELALTRLGTGTRWTRLVPGLLVTGLGTGIVNAALGRIAVQSVPHGRVAMGAGANNTARYLGGATGAALAVSIATAGGPHELINGWNTAALVAAGLCALGVAIVASCRQWRRDPRPALAAGTTPATTPRVAVPTPDASNAV